MAKVQMTVEIRPRFWVNAAIKLSGLMLQFIPEQQKERLIPKIAKFIARKGHKIEVLGLIK